MTPLTPDERESINEYLLNLLNKDSTMSEDELMSVESAIRILLRVHVWVLDDPPIPVVTMGAVPEYDDPRYTKAWLTLWEKYGNK